MFLIFFRANQRSLDEKRDKLRKYKKSSSPTKRASLSPEPVANSAPVKRVSFQHPVPDQSLVDIGRPDRESHSRSPSLPPSLEEISPEEEKEQKEPE